MGDNGTILPFHLLQGKDAGYSRQFFSAEATHNTRLTEESLHRRVRTGDGSCMRRSSPFPRLGRTRLDGCNPTSLPDQGSCMMEQLVRLLDLLNVQNLDL